MATEALVTLPTENAESSDLETIKAEVDVFHFHKKAVWLEEATSAGVDDFRGICIVDLDGLLEKYTLCAGDAKKYPRTPHLKNFGAATGDDHGKHNRGSNALRAASAFLNLVQQSDKDVMLTIAEKIDGSNLGFALIDGKLVFKSRGKGVNAEIHAQWTGLESWLDANEGIY